MKAIRSWSKLLLLFLPLSLFGGSCLPVPQELATDLVYTRTGGIAGVLDHATVLPDGTIQTSGTSWGDRTGTLSPQQLDELLQLVRYWSLLAVPVQGPVCPDAFAYSITYAGKTLQWTDCTPVVPEQLRRIAQWIERAAAALEPGENEN